MTALNEHADLLRAITAVMQEIGAIHKDQFNEHGNYPFRGIDDVYNALQPALVKHGLVIIPRVLECRRGHYTTANDRVMQLCTLKVEYGLFHPESSGCLTATTMGEGADTADKAINKAHTAAFKTFVFETFVIPTQEKSDSEFQSPAGAGVDKPAYSPSDADDEEFML